MMLWASTFVAGGTAAPDGGAVEDAQSAVRRCCDCKMEKPLDGFHMKATDRLGRTRICKPCANARSSAAYQRNREKAVQAAVRWKKENPERAKATASAWRKANRETINAKKRSRWEMIKALASSGDSAAEASLEKAKARMAVYNRRLGRNLAKYGLTIDAWARIFEAQEGCCAICRTESPGHKYGWHTDHDHGTGEVRGILCGRCNFRLGAMGDTAESIQRNTQGMLSYLRTVDYRVGARVGQVVRRTSFSRSQVTTFGEVA